MIQTFSQMERKSIRISILKFLAKLTQKTILFLIQLSMFFMHTHQTQYFIQLFIFSLSSLFSLLLTIYFFPHLYPFSPLTIPTTTMLLLQFLLFQCSFFLFSIYLVEFQITLRERLNNTFENTNPFLRGATHNLHQLHPNPTLTKHQTLHLHKEKFYMFKPILVCPLDQNILILIFFSVSFEGVLGLYVYKIIYFSIIENNSLI